MKSYDVIIVGGGVAGLSAAATFVKMGITKVRVLERERQAGGIPRHCGHYGFGFREFGVLYRGPDYAKRLVEEANKIELSPSTSVMALAPDGILTINAGHGLEKIRGRAIILAMGARETPRSARLISGTRPLQGILNTGALQQMTYLYGERPFSNPVILGSELVSFSALLTLRHAGIKAKAMIEENHRITARRPADWIARLIFGVPVHLNTRLLSIHGLNKVEAVEIDRGNGSEILECDGIIVSGKFRPENALLTTSHLKLDSGTLGPAIDQIYRCSDSIYFAAGNLLRPIETAGQCWREGQRLAKIVARSLEGTLPVPQTIPVTCAGALRYVYPHSIDRGMPIDDPLQFKARVYRETKGWLRVLADGKEINAKYFHALPERRIAWHISPQALASAQTIEVRLDEQ